MVDLASLLLLSSFFGMKISILYVVLGLIIAIVGGTIISKLNMESEIKVYTEETSELYDESTGYEVYGFDASGKRMKKGWNLCKDTLSNDKY